MKQSSQSEKAKARRERLMKYIIAYKRKHDGNSPTVRQMVEPLGYKTTSLVTYHLALLERQKRIRISRGVARGIYVVGGEWLYKPSAV